MPMKTEISSLNKKEFKFRIYGLMSDKKQFTDNEIDSLAGRFKILSEPSRLKILRTLFDGEKCVTEIIDETGLLQANVSKQLKILQKDGIVNCRAQGLQRFYHLEDYTVLKICNIICETSQPEHS